MQRIIPFAAAMLFHMTQARGLQGTAASNTTQFGEIATENIIAESMKIAEVEESGGNGYDKCFATLDEGPSTSGTDDSSSSDYTNDEFTSGSDDSTSCYEPDEGKGIS